MFESCHSLTFENKLVGSLDKYCQRINVSFKYTLKLKTIFVMWKLYLLMCACLVRLFARQRQLEETANAFTVFILIQKWSTSKVCSMWYLLRWIYFDVWRFRCVARLISIIDVRIWYLFDRKDSISGLGVKKQAI